MSRDEHDGNTKCQCCAQAKRQYEEILREIETRFVRSAKIIEEMGAASHKRKTPAHRTVIDAEKERYRLLTGCSIWKTASEPESLQRAKQLQKLDDFRWTYSSHYNFQKRSYITQAM